MKFDRLAVLSLLAISAAACGSATDDSPTVSGGSELSSPAITRARIDGCGVDPSLFAAPLEESANVPNDQLITDFSIVRTSGVSDVAVLPVLFRVAVDSDHGPTQLKISDTDVLEFSVGSSSVICREGQECRLPLVEGATYSVDFTRAAGARVRASITLPRETHILSPAQNAFFAKESAVDISWSPTSSTGNSGLTLSTFLQDPTCNTNGFIDWYSDFRAKVPAGYVDCPGDYRERFSTFYTNIARVPGVAGGAIKGYSVAELVFWYLEGGAPFAHHETPAPLSGCELRQFVKASETGARVTEIVQR